MEDRVRKWILTIGVFLIGFGLIWANYTVSRTDEIRKDSVAVCERDRLDRIIQKEGWRAAELARRASAARTTGEESSGNLRAAEQYANLQRRLTPLIHINCEKEFG
jgi:hypothetical protein